MLEQAAVQGGPSRGMFGNSRECISGSAGYREAVEEIAARFDMIE